MEAYGHFQPYDFINNEDFFDDAYGFTAHITITFMSPAIIYFTSTILL